MDVLRWTIALALALCIHSGTIAVFWILNGADLSILRPFIRCILVGGLYFAGAQILCAILSHLQQAKCTKSAYWDVLGCIFKLLTATWVFLMTSLPTIAWLAFITSEIVSLFSQFSPWDYNQRYHKFLTVYEVFNPRFDEESRTRTLYGATRRRLVALPEPKRPPQDLESRTEDFKVNIDNSNEVPSSKMFPIYSSTTENIHSSNNMLRSSSNVNSDSTINQYIPSEEGLWMASSVLQTPDFKNLRKLQSMPVLRKNSQDTLNTPLSISPKVALLTPWSWTSLEDSLGPENPKTIRKKLSTFTLNFEPKERNIGEMPNSCQGKRKSVSSDETTSLLSHNTTLHNSIESEPFCTHDYKHFTNFTQYYLDSCAVFPIDPYFLKFGKLQSEFSGAKFAMYVIARLAALYSIAFSGLLLKVSYTVIIAFQGLIPLEKADIFLVYDASLSVTILFVALLVKIL